MAVVVKSRYPMFAMALVTLGLCGCFLSPQQKEARFLALGKAQYAKKDYPRAILEFRSAIRIAPSDADAYYQLGLAYSAVNDVGSARLCFTKATKLNPKHVEAQLKLAALLLKSPGKDTAEDAESRVKTALGSAPATAEGLNMLAFSELRLGKEEDAIGHLRQALNRFPADLDSSVLLMRIKLSKGDIKGAEEILRQCVAKDPRSAEAALALGRFYLVTKKFDQAEQQLRRALQINPSDGPALRDLGMLQIQQGKNQQAEQTFKQLAALPDKSYRPLHALFLWEFDQRDAAVREFERIAAADPSDRDARTRLVTAYFLTGRSADAEKTLSHALDQNRKDTDALLQRATLFIRARKYQEAQNDLNQVLRFQPELAQAHATLAALYEARGAPLSERQELSEALRLNSGLLPVRLNLARLLISSKAPDAALDTLDKAFDFQKRALPFIVQRNWALLALGRKEELRKGVDLGLAASRTPDLLAQDAILKAAEKNYAGAKSSLDEALKQDPENLRALEALLRLYAIQKKTPEAIQSIRAYAAQRPRSAVLQEILGNLLAADGKRAEARSAYMQAKAFDPRSSSAVLGLATLDVLDGKFDSARQALAGLETLDPQNPQVWIYRGLLETNQKNYPRAIEAYRKAVELDPKNVLALNNLAYLLATHINQTDEALKFVQQAKEMAPGLPDIDDTMGWVLYNKGVYQSALGYLESALKKHDDPAVRYHLALTYAKVGDKRGVEMLRKELKAAPQLPEAEIAQQVLTEASRSSK
jgi:putative PEP-CTERM system TPR-repeat lipoprotein